MHFSHYPRHHFSGKTLFEIVRQCYLTSGAWRQQDCSFIAVLVHGVTTNDLLLSFIIIDWMNEWTNEWIPIPKNKNGGHCDSANYRGVALGSILDKIFSPPDVSLKDLKFYPLTFFFFLFYQSTVLISNAEDGDQMYFGGTVVDKASTIIGIGILLTLP